MNCRNWNLDNDYDMVTEWLKGHHFNSLPPKNILSNYGIIVEEDNKSICAAALYMDTGERKSGFAYMYGIFSDPKANKIKLVKAMKMCLNGIKKLAKTNDIDLIWTTTGESALLRLYPKNGMTLVENNLSAFIVNVNDKYTDHRWLMSAEIENELTR